MRGIEECPFKANILLYSKDLIGVWLTVDKSFEMVNVYIGS